MSNALLALCALGYWASAISFHYNLFHRKQRDWTQWLRILLSSHAVHSLALLTLTLQLKHLPVLSMPEVMAVLGWALIALYAVLGRRWKVDALGGIAAPAAAVLTTFATFTLGHETPHSSAVWWPAMRPSAWRPFVRCSTLSSRAGSRKRNCTPPSCCPP